MFMSGTVRRTHNAAPADGRLIELYSTQYQSLVRLAAGVVHQLHAAEDVVQDSFIRSRPYIAALSDESAVRYLRRAVLNSALNARRHEEVATRAQRRLESRFSSVTESATPEEIVLEQHRLANLREQVSRLPQRQRNVTLLRYLLDLSVSETAKTLHISEGAVKAATTRALNTLANQLTEGKISDQPGN